MKWFNSALLLFICIALYLLWLGNGGRIELKEKQLILEEKAAEIVELKKRNQLLQAEVESLENGLDAIEERARTELGMIKDGETFIQIINEELPKRQRTHKKQ
ncbi:septum formation initiator family protein [Marinicella rhabdoformis]|uniref:septum formation initiator family protein n=1 Tax=Marinicella rhabdoformis TaxID=2580566 RepID=UPI0012AEB33E|nr:septum formation initiator family protein [Marinicella rhabdoformis]